MDLTIKELKERIKNLPDDMEVCIERIHDCYFEKYNWSSTKVDFGNGDGIEFTKASSIARVRGKFIICAHI